jgi:ABC-type nitrate/sulfonate/bicarbonate transport system permease component
MSERPLAQGDAAAGEATAAPAAAPEARERTRTRRRGRSFWQLRLLSILFVLALWEWGGRIPISLAFPTCTETLGALASMFADGTLLTAYADTIQPLLIGLALCGLGAVTAGVAMGLSRPVEWLTLPVFVILQAAPMAAIIPVITFIYGIGLAAKVFAVVLLAAPVIVLNSYKGIRHVNASLLEMSRSFLASRRQQILKIILPSASGMIFAGLRLGAAQGFTGVILAELLITPTGVGDLITYYRSVADYPRMFASILSIIVLASVAITLLQKVEETLFRPELQSA